MSMGYKGNRNEGGKSFFSSFSYAFEGLVHAFRHEKNLKIDLVIAGVVICFGLILRISFFEWIAIIFAIGGVISLELMNTAIERTVDLVTSEFHPLAKQAKDIAAASVLFFAIISAIIGCFIFLPKIWQFII